MVTTVSVVALSSGDEGQVGDLVASLDAQTLPWSAFELVVVADQEGPAAARLGRLARRRPNLTVLADGSPWLDACAGEQVLLVQPGDVLYPEALERLTTFAAAHGLDAVAARPVRPGAGPGTLTADRDHLDAGEVQADGAAALLVRRDLVEADGTPRLDESAAVGALAGYPALLRRGPAAPEHVLTLHPERGDAHWTGTVLEVSATGTVAGTTQAGTTQAGTTDATWSALVRDAASQLSFLLPCQGELTSGPDDASPGWRVAVQLDVATAAAGAPLPPGVWEVDVFLSTGSTTSGPGTLQAELASSAVLDGQIVPGSPKAGVLQVDVGGASAPVVVAAEPGNISIVDSAAGSLMTWRLPEVVVHGSSTTPGWVLLGSFRLPAVLRADGDGARIECYLSGLAGTSRLSAQFGEVTVTTRGLDLVVAGDGAMSVVRTVRQPAKKPAAKKPAAPKPAPRPKASKPAAPKPAKPLSRVQHLRRALPAQVSPLVDALARQPVARRLYRRAAGLTRSR